MPINTPLPVIPHNDAPAVRLNGRLYRWDKSRNDWQDRSSWSPGDQVVEYWETRSRAALFVVAKVNGISLPAEYWEAVIE